MSVFLRRNEGKYCISGEFDLRRFQKHSRNDQDKEMPILAVPVVNKLNRKQRKKRKMKRMKPEAVNKLPYLKSLLLRKYFISHKGRPLPPFFVLLFMRGIQIQCKNEINNEQCPT